MGGTSSKAEKTEALKMCKLRKKMIKQGINSRNSIAAAHISYIQSLKNIGIALRRFAEAEMLLESSTTTTTTTTNVKTPSNSSSPSHIAEECEPETDTRLSFMKKNDTNNVSLTFRYNPTDNTHHLVDNVGSNDVADDNDDVLVLPPPPPPPPDGATWDYFDTGGGGGEEEEVVAEVSGSKIDKGLVEEREDASEFITHRAKDFLSSIKDIETRFFRASECGKDVARMLEANRIRVGFAEGKGSSSPLDALATYPLVCCRGKSVHASNENHTQSVPKVIIWNRSMSSHSSSSRNPLATASKDDTDDSGSEHVEEFFMISGSHSSTLDRLYAWERKLYDEVKASEVLRKHYDKKCNHLRHQVAKDHSKHAIDKTRAAVKDLHSRIRVALHAVDTIAKRIEKMRDEELLPQLTELISGFIRMWKAMLECHHAQYITISLAYHAKTSATIPRGDTRREITTQLQYEFECFGLSFADWMNSHTSYVEALNGWLQNCVLQPQERARGSRRPLYSPRRDLAPPIFVLCRDWSAGIRALPSEDVSDAIRNFLNDVNHLVKQQHEDENKDASCQENDEGKAEGDSKSANLGGIHTSLTKVLDKLTKFSEASLKLYEDIRQKCEAARVAYSNPRPFRMM